MGQEGERDETGGVTNWKVCTFDGVEVQLQIYGPAGAEVEGVLENIMAGRHLYRGGCLLTSGRAGH